MDDLSTPLLDSVNNKLANPEYPCEGGQTMPPTTSPQTMPPTTVPNTASPTPSPHTKTPTQLPTPEPTFSAVTPTIPPVMTSAPTAAPTSSQPQEPTPMYCPAGYTGLRPADSCTKFYHCVNGVVTGDKLSCTAGTLFDVRYNFCNWADQVTCDIEDPPITLSPTAAPTSSQPQEPTPMSCPAGYTGLRPADSCTKFYHCVNGAVTGDKLSCPAGTLFDVRYNFCNWSDQVTCDGGSIRRYLRHPKKD